MSRLEPEAPKRAEQVGRFITYNNGTALDTKTNLMWMTQDSRNIEGRAPATWDEAMAWVEKMNQQRYGAHSNWRVPTTAEYQAIYDAQATKRSYSGSNYGILKCLRMEVGCGSGLQKLAQVGAYLADLLYTPILRCMAMTFVEDCSPLVKPTSSRQEMKASVWYALDLHSASELCRLSKSQNGGCL